MRANETTNTQNHQAPRRQETAKHQNLKRTERPLIFYIFKVFFSPFSCGHVTNAKTDQRCSKGPIKQKQSNSMRYPSIHRNPRPVTLVLKGIKRHFKVCLQTNETKGHFLILFNYSNLINLSKMTPLACSPDLYWSLKWFCHITNPVKIKKTFWESGCIRD